MRVKIVRRSKSLGHYVLEGVNIYRCYYVGWWTYTGGRPEEFLSSDELFGLEKLYSSNPRSDSFQSWARSHLKSVIDPDPSEEIKDYWDVTVYDYPVHTIDKMRLKSFMAIDIKQTNGLYTYALFDTEGYIENDQGKTIDHICVTKQS